MNYETIANNIKEIRKEIAQAAEKVNKTESDIVLVAATKNNDTEAVKAAIAGGVDACGENRVQELKSKLEENAYEGKPLHYIGTLQSNKVKYIVGHCTLIQSVDSIKLAAEIERVAKLRDIVQDILIQINIGNEDTKSGITAEEAPAFIEEVSKFKHVHICGLMTIPPHVEKNGTNCSYFKAMHKLYVDISHKKYDNVNMNYLSMGMSDDYAEAIVCGSNMIRVGTKIFGSRKY